MTLLTEEYKNTKECGLRYQVRVMSQAPWHYYLDTVTGKAYTRFPVSGRENKEIEIPAFLRVKGAETQVAQSAR